MRYAVVIGKTGGQFTAQVPDLPGCSAKGGTLAEAQKAIREAIRLHLAKLERDGQKAPEPVTVVEFVEA